MGKPHVKDLAANHEDLSLRRPKASVIAIRAYRKLRILWTPLQRFVPACRRALCSLQALFHSTALSHSLKPFRGRRALIAAAGPLRLSPFTLAVPFGVHPLRRK